MVSHWLKHRKEQLKKNAIKMVNGEKVVRAIPWEDNLPSISCPYCRFVYEGSVDWKGELWDETEKIIYAITVERWQNNLPYKVKCLNCGKWIIFDPDKREISKGSELE